MNRVHSSKRAQHLSGFNQSGPITSMETELEKLQSSEIWLRLREDFYRDGDAVRVQAGLTEAIDRMSMEGFQATLGPAYPSGLALLAVGGYGRRAQFPYSDVDILVLLENEELAHSLKEHLSEFMRILWDAGLRLSHSVHSVEDCVAIHEGNIEFNISLLDRRFLVGDASVFQKLQSRMPPFLLKNGPKLAKHLCEMTRTRHNKFEGTLFHLEPDVKETPGGLRDLNFIGWLNALKPDSHTLASLTADQNFLASLRCFLHYEAGRDSNVLNFELQEQIAGQAFSQANTAPLWMREYFNHARAVYRETQRTLDATERSATGPNLLSAIRDLRSRPSSSEFTVSRDRVLLKSPTQLERDPQIVLRLLEFIARHGISAAAETERRVEAAVPHFVRWYAQSPIIWPALKVMLGLPHASLALRMLQDTALMQVIFPYWEKIVSLVVRDFYHRYTVDEHTLVCFQKLEELRTTKDPALRRFAGLLAEIDNPAVLFYGLIYHDVGKGAFSGKHSQVGEVWVREALAGMGAPAEEQETAAFLVLHHLALSDVMRGRDLADPATARAVADRVGTIERLKMLTVLTYADIAGVNPGAMTPWRLEQLWGVFRVAQEELTRELETDRIQDVPKELESRSLPRLDFIKGFPVRYLRTHSSAEIEGHVALYEASRPTGVATSLVRVGGGWRLTVVARDMPSLFAFFAGALSSFGLDILKAEAFSNDKGLILDTFVLADPKRTLELNPSEADRLRDLIQKVALGKADVQKLLRSRPQPEGKRNQDPPSVVFDSEACETATLVQINAEDRPGLLFSLADVFSQACCNIDVVLIDTKGHRAMDVFYVAQQGQKLSDDAQAKLKVRLLSVC